MLVAATAALAAQTPLTAPAAAKPAAPGDAVGVVLLDTAPGGKRDMPPVSFNHDAHTKALEKQGKGCESCHQPLTPGSKSDFSYKFRNTKGKPAGTLKDLYHTGCISCHAEQSKADAKTGPVEAECRSCHNGPAKAKSAQKSRADGGFDASMHARHIQSKSFAIVAGENADADRCASCHHPAPTPLPAGLKADSCRSCHGKGLEKQGMPFSKMAHESCISCHLKASVMAKPSGPVNCAGCHDAGVKATHKRLPEVPRLQAGQPDAVLMLAGGKNATAGQNATQPGLAKGLFTTVPFDHKLHEKAAPSCISCHHNTLQACSSCHTPAGDAKGNYKTLNQVMHKPDSARSCVGCHESRKTTQPQCAGCHSSTPRKASPASCATCHTAPAGVPLEQAHSGALSNLPRAAKQDIARATIMNRSGAATESTAPKALAMGPETVTIGVLSKEFEPSVMPHGRIVRALAEGIAKTNPSWSKLHATDYTLCRSCHHNSPDSPGAANPVPPKCVSCHAQSGPLPADGRPLLKQAYHQQCMGCHQRMQLKKPADTACSACHTKRAPAQ